MKFKTLISTSEVNKHKDDPNWAIVDCRFALDDPNGGETDYLSAHIPGAVYAHLDRDLSGTVIPGKTGRHPLPGIDVAAKLFSNLGIGPDVQVVAYDDVGGALAAARLWWMLRWLGHDGVAVLDGGWGQWLTERRGIENGMRRRQRREFKPEPRPELLVSANHLELMGLGANGRIIDVRAPERFRGEVEPFDPVAGRIRGAVNVPYKDNLDATGMMIPVDEMRSLYERLLGDIPAERTVFYCGSGVTAALNILAVQHAGLGEARLYAGSWSEWITDPRRPTTKG